MKRLLVVAVLLFSACSPVAAVRRDRAANGEVRGIWIVQSDGEAIYCRETTANVGVVPEPGCMRVRFWRAR